jgi:hypothetical protein
MQKFSKDLMGLSIDNLLDEKNGISTKLIKKLEELENKDIILFRDEIKDIRKKLEKVYTKKEYEYQTFYCIAEDVASEERGYLAVAISLIFEGVSFYLYTALRSKSDKLKDFFDNLEKRAKKQRNFTLYNILDLCRGVFILEKEGDKYYIHYRKTGKKNLYRKPDFVSDDILKELFDKKQEIIKEKGRKLIYLLKDSKNLRNNLLHANSGDKVADVEKEVKDLLRKYKTLLLKDFEC